jgi:hypothetical protein
MSTVCAANPELHSKICRAVDQGIERLARASAANG